MKNLEDAERCSDDNHKGKDELQRCFIHITTHYRLVYHTVTSQSILEVAPIISSFNTTRILSPRTKVQPSHEGLVEGRCEGSTYLGIEALGLNFHMLTYVSKSEPPFYFCDEF